LSKGQICAGELVCPYHGFRFGPDGQCTHLPVHPSQPPPRSLRLTRWVVTEAHGLVWLWYGTGAPAPEVPWFADHAGHRPTAATGSLVYNVHYSRLVESNFDIYHFPFVHRSIDPGVGAQVDDFEVKVNKEAIFTSGNLVSATGKRTPFFIDFQPPNVQRLRFAGIDAVLVSTPIDAHRTWAFARYEQTLITRPAFLARWMAAATLWFEWTIVQTRQDMPVLSTLDPKESAPGACVWVRADAGAARYVQWRARQSQGAVKEKVRASSAL
jgi:phenylpropionate dioxygenase-like ring-hydroxylating dioxygenase large terminal subunit